MKRFGQLAPRLIGAGAALFAGSALAAQIYLNPLAGDETVDNAGLTLLAPIAATSFTSLTQLSNTDSAPIVGSYTELIKKSGNAAYVDTHTVSGWFKVNALPTGTGIQVLWLTNNGQNSAGGYQVAVNASGQLVIGRANSAGTFFDSGSATSTNLEGKITTNDTVITAGEWTHITVAFSVGTVGDTTPLSPSVFVNGVSKALSAPTFKTNLNGNAGCSSIKLGAGIFAAGFYVDGTAITNAETIRSLAVSPAKNIYVDKWTRRVPGNGGWHPTTATNYYWSGENVNASEAQVQPLVYRGEATLSVTTNQETSASTITLNGSPTLTAFTTAYGSGGAGTLKVDSSTYKLTAETTTISAQTVLLGTGFSLGNLSITSTGTLSVGTNRDFTLTSIADGSNKLSITPTDAEVAAGRIPLRLAEGVTLTTTNVKVGDNEPFTIKGGTLFLSTDSTTPTWTPTAGDLEWANNWSNVEAAPNEGTVILDLSKLTADQTVEIPASAGFTATTIIGARESVPVIASGTSLGTLTVLNRATLPAAIPASSVILETGAVLSLTGEGTLSAPVSGTGALRIASGTTTLSQTNTNTYTYTGGTIIETGATVILENTDALGTTANITGSGTIKGGAFVPTCDLTNAGWTGTFEFASISDTEVNAMDWRKLGNSGSKVLIPSDVTITGHFNDGNWTLAAAVELNGTIDLTNGHSGSSGNTYTFAGALTGAGTFKHTTTSNPTNAVILQNASGFDGTLTIASGINRTFIIGTAHTYSNDNTTGDKGKIVIAGPVKASALSRWSAPNGLVFEGAELDGGTEGITLNQKIVTNANAQPLTIRGKVTLTSADCTFNGPVTVAENGSLTWQHNGKDKEISGAVTVKEGATFATVADYKYALTLSGALSGAGTVRVKVPTAGSQHDGARFLNLEGACAGFTGTVELEITVTGATSNSETMPRRTSVVIKPSDNVFNGSIDVVKVAGSSPFADTDTAVDEGLWPYSKIFFANICTFTGTIGGQGTVYIGRTGDRDNTKRLADNGAPSTTAGAVTLEGTLGDVVTTNGDTTATFAGQIFVAGADRTTEGVACPAASVAFTTTTKQIFSGALTGAGWKTFGVEGSAGTFEVSGTFGEAVADDPHRYAVKHTGGITIAPGSSLTMAMTASTKFAGSLSSDGKPGAALVIASGKSVALSAANGNYSGTITVEKTAILSNAGSSQAIPFGKGSMTNNGAVELKGSNGILPPIFGSGNITFCPGSVTRIAGEIKTTGTVTFEPANEEGAAAAVVTFVSSTDFSEKVASINGASVVVGEGVTLAKDETSTPLITIAVGRSLSGSGTINVPVAFANETTATMPPEASLTFGSTLAVPKNVILPGTVKLARTAVISGAGRLSGTVTFAEGATIDATASTVESLLVFTGTPTFAETIPVKVARRCSLFSVPSTVNLTAEKVSLTWAGSAIAGSKVMLSTVGNTTTARLFVPPTVSVTEDPENPRDAGVNAAIAQAAETRTGWGTVISEVTAISATGTDGKSTRDVNAAALFDGVLTLIPSGDTKADGTVAATATVTYDFGVSQITVKKAQLTGDTAPQNYVLACAKVSNGKTEEATAAGYADGTKVSLLLDRTEAPGAVALDTATLSNKFGVTAGLGEQWFAVPMSTLGTGTHAFTVKASKTTTAN